MKNLEKFEFMNVGLVELNELDLMAIEGGAKLSDLTVRFLTWCGDSLSSVHMPRFNHLASDDTLWG